MTILDLLANVPIATVFEEKDPDRDRSRLLLVLVDGTWVAITAEGSNIEVEAFDGNDRATIDSLLQEHFPLVAKARRDREDPEAKKLHYLFHSLWTKACNSDQYVKAEWGELRSRLAERGVVV